MCFNEEPLVSNSALDGTVITQLCYEEVVPLKGDLRVVSKHS